MTYRFQCPEGCVWQSELVNLRGEPFDGIACPTHRLFCKRNGGPKLRPYWKRRAPR
jgi:hypothetical protein